MRKRVLEITKPEEIKELIDCIDYFGLIPICVGNGTDYPSLESWKVRNEMPLPRLSTYIYIDLKDTKLEITTRYWTKYYPYGTQCTYILDLNGEPINTKSGLDCYSEFCKYFKITPSKNYNIEELENTRNFENGKYTLSAKPLVGFKGPRKMEKPEVVYNCYEYDINSAYASILMKKMPDLEHPIYDETKNRSLIVEENEIGFYLNDSALKTIKPGFRADIKFKLIDTPEESKKYLINWYFRKKNSTGSEKETAKAMLNYPVGYSQLTNPFFRAYVVNSCNEVINNLIDENTLLWNTDAIICKNKRDDLKIGLEIGEFKEIPIKRLVYKENTYQIDDDFPKWRHVAKTWFKNWEKVNGRPFDLAIDYQMAPPRANKYYFDWETLQLNEVNYEK